MKRFSICLSLLFYVSIVFTQSLNDAIRYSVLEVGGTARTVGVGGGIGALGADFSTLSTNPAGLATYRRAELVFSPSFEQFSTSAYLKGGNNPIIEQEKNNFNFNALGMVFATRPNSSKWKGSAFGIGINRLANYHDKLFFEGTSPGSITDRWLEMADGRSQLHWIILKRVWLSMARQFIIPVLQIKRNTAAISWMARRFLKSKPLKKKAPITKWCSVMQQITMKNSSWV